MTENGLAHNPHPLGKQLLDWAPDPAIARTISLNYDAHAGHFVIAWRPPGEIQSIDGRNCLVGPYFLFDVDDTVAFDTDATVTVDLLFDRSTTDGFYINYDQVIKPASKKIVFDKDAKGRWQRATVKLERARFANRKYEGTDFAIGALGATHPHDAADDATVTLCDLGLHFGPDANPSTDYGKLKLKVVNETDNPEAVRVGLYDTEGRAPLAGDSALTVLRYVEKVKQLSLLDTNVFWPGPGRYVFYIDGQYETALPAGLYNLVVGKGPEYRILQQQVQINSNRTSEVLVKLERWIDMPASGWFSGDDHIHIGRSDASENNMILAYTRAEDIHVANLLQMGNLATWHYPQYAFGHAGQFISAQHALVAGQESPRTAHLGHTVGLNGQAFYWSENNYYLYQTTADQIHKDGGLFGYAHIALADMFTLDRGLVLDVPLGYVDFVEVLQMGVLNTRHLYNFLNLGYQLLPAAGSDYPYIHVAGTERIYVHVPGKFSPKAWFDAWRTGRSFVTNGPVLTFTVNGDKDSNQFDIARGDKVEIIAMARVNPDLDDLTRLELVVQGDVVATSSVHDENGIQLQYTLQPGASTWFALRTFGKRGAVAHTAPVYVPVDGNKRFWKRDAVDRIARDYIKALAALRRSTPDPYGDFEMFNTRGLILSDWDATKPALDEQISRAIESYDSLRKAASLPESE